MNGQGRGAEMLFVPRTEKLNPVMLVKANANLLPLATLAPFNREWMGAGMLNVELVTPVNPVEVKEMVAPVTALLPKAVRPLKVALPEDAAFVVVPPRVQEPAPT